MVDEGSLPCATNPLPSLPSASESLRTASCVCVCVCACVCVRACVCVLGVVPWSSQVMEQSDAKSGAHGQQSFWMVGGQCAGYCC